MTDQTATYYTLGCKLNFAESSDIGRTLAERGFRRAQAGEPVSICVVNTCAVTQLAEKKCRQAIRRIARLHPEAFLVVTGCYAQLHPEELAGLEGVDLVLGVAQKQDIFSYLSSLVKKKSPAVITSSSDELRTFVPSCSADDRTRHFLKVQDGCDYRCSYCTIPFARGHSRNGSVASLIQQARQVVLSGGKEIVLTGVNIGDFGRTTAETFMELLIALDDVEGILRYRISSIEPNLLTDDILNFTSVSQRFAPHFHLPLQSGSDDVLRLMRRRYDTVFFRRRVERIRQILPHAFIGVDVIAGMNGESDAFFEQSFRFLEELPFSRLHVFTYSERPHTDAMKYAPVVDETVRRERTRRLTALSEKKHRAFYENAIGRDATVLFEYASKGTLMYGFTENYVRIEAPYDSHLINRALPVRPTAWNDTYTALTISPYIYH
ncbi:MAG: tRNA (N(6)-L-threonylcarbamoyladenosine(37)-C(2))-methylthiotransferase MtaB [Tannerellaceae bacterium]|nr:tRNA (N(6)-L-threonylcarbamoyladenosine(37)-C(2))-methylthiotransferase MtaB [Tannerellaceae bacterium]